MIHCARILIALLGLLGSAGLAGCEELGNPLPGTGSGPESGLVRSTDSALGTLVTEVRYVAPADAQALIAALGSEVDHLDRAVPPGGALVVVTVRPTVRPALVGFVHLVTDFGHPDGTVERRVWTARAERPRYVALFGLHATPSDVRTTTM